jgi:hypothetical protein
MSAEELRTEIRSIIVRYPEEQVADVLRLVELAIEYTRMMQNGLA